MTQLVDDLLKIMLPSFAGGVLFVFLAKNWFLERLRGGIKSEYDQVLERLKAELNSRNSKEIEGIKAALSKEATLISTVQKSFGESHAAFQSHRIHAIKGLWEAILHVSRNSPSIFTFLDVLLPNEYDETLAVSQFKTFSDITNEDIMKMLSDKAMEAQNHRLFSGDYLWSLFGAYQALSARISFLFMNGRVNKKVDPWFADAGCLSIVRSVCTASEFAEFENLQFSKIIWIRNLIESKFLLASNRILSGQASADIAMEEARRIAVAISSLKQHD